MTTYRSRNTIEAVQYQGEPIPDVTCDANSPDKNIADKARLDNGCNDTRRQHPHVHTQATGGLTVLKPGDWIFPLPGGPWGVASDGRFRGSWEVPPPPSTPPPTVAGEKAPVEIAAEAPKAVPVSEDSFPAEPEL